MTSNFRRLSNVLFEPVSQWVMVAGIIALVQPWNLFAHRYGVLIILIGLVGFLVFSHIKPDPDGE